ncbi:hypothetical protein AB8998_29150 [Mycobacterium sp. HUMS_12744610]|uniref:Uncharacterized protein n=1 Tax=Mycobacterium servetii TaxID=3237418 RepID=A0ABV4C8S4_9MYCO
MTGDNSAPVPAPGAPGGPNPSLLSSIPGPNLPPGTTIKVTPDTLSQALYGVPLPPPIAPTPAPPTGTSPADAASGALVAASNAGVPGDVASSTEADADRRAHAADALAKFPANEANSAQQMQAVGAQAGGQQGMQMVQQMVSSVTGALTGALGGIMGPLTQLPQQAMQAGQSAMQPLMSAVQQASHGAEALAAGDPTLVDSVGSGSELGAGGGGGGIGGLGGTTPAASLGPPPVPGSSPPTSPAGAPAKPVAMPPADGTAPARGSTGMTGMPMMPGVAGAGGEGAKDKPVEKRVSAPGVPNGQPVKGRLTALPPSAPVAKHADGKPTVVTNRPNRRIVIMPSEDEAKE